MGFEPQIREVVLGRGMPPKDQRRTFMFAATFAADIQLLAKEFLREYIWVTVGRVGSTVENITQTLLPASRDRGHKMGLLLEALAATNGRTLVFVQMKKMVRTPIVRIARIHPIACVGGLRVLGAEQQLRHICRGDPRGPLAGAGEFALRQFRSGASRVLVATDVAARGLDIPQVTHVVQFDLPTSADDFDSYVHRIGRTGRAGAKGLATALYVPGREAEGNGRIAPLILRLLQENQQAIPDWFLALDDVHDTGAAGPSRRTYPQRDPQQRDQQRGAGVNFGSRDVRGGPRFTSGQLPRFAAPVLAEGGYLKGGGYAGYGMPQQPGYYDPQPPPPQMQYGYPSQQGYTQHQQQYGGGYYAGEAAYLAEYYYSGGGGTGRGQYYGEEETKSALQGEMPLGVGMGVLGGSPEGSSGRYSSGALGGGRDYYPQPQQPALHGGIHGTSGGGGYRPGYMPPAPGGYVRAPPPPRPYPGRAPQEPSDPSEQLAYTYGAGDDAQQN